MRVIDVDLEDCRRRERRGLEGAFETCAFDRAGEVSWVAVVVDAVDDSAPPIRGSRIFRPVEAVPSALEGED